MQCLALFLHAAVLLKHNITAVYRELKTLNGQVMSAQEWAAISLAPKHMVELMKWSNGQSHSKGKDAYRYGH